MNKRVLFSIVGLVILVISVAAGVFFIQRQQELRARAEPATSLSFSPPSKSVKEGESFSASVTINTSKNIVSQADIQINYSPQLVEVEGITPGNFLPQVLRSGKTDNILGRASISLSSLPTQPKQGSGTLAVLTMRAVSAGTATVVFSPETKVLAVGEGDKDVLASKGSASFSIVAAAVPSPSPTVPPVSPSPSPAVSPSPKPTATPAGAIATPIASPSPTTKATVKPTASPEELPAAGVSFPTILALGAGVILFILGIALAF